MSQVVLKSSLALERPHHLLIGAQCVVGAWMGRLSVSRPLLVHPPSGERKAPTRKSRTSQRRDGRLVGQGEWLGPAAPCLQQTPPTAPPSTLRQTCL